MKTPWQNPVAKPRGKPRGKPHYIMCGLGPASRVKPLLVIHARANMTQILQIQEKIQKILALPCRARAGFSSSAKPRKPRAVDGLCGLGPRRGSKRSVILESGAFELAKSNKLFPPLRHLGPWLPIGHTQARVRLRYSTTLVCLGNLIQPIAIFCELNQIKISIFQK